MYIIKNALKCISRSKARNVLIAIIVLVIAISACLGLSIKQAAITAREDALETLSITATISFDRQKTMSNFSPPSGQQGSGGGRPSFDQNEFAEMMGSSSALTLDEYKKYAEASSVKDFYYESSININGSENLIPISNETTDSEETENEGSFGGGKDFPNNFMPNFSQIMGAQSDFTVIGYSSESAMTSFINGTATISDGEIFAEGTSDYNCIISKELATYNSLAVGDEIVLTNPNNEEETYTLNVVGIYTDSSANENSFSMSGMTSNDPANRIYMSYTALSRIVSASAEASETVTDETTGREFETAMSESVSATYVFSNVENYELFCEQVKDMGLSDSYTVSSSDVKAFENSLAPLDTLSNTAGKFLTVILIIGAIVLVVLNIFSVRERKYEIGVLTAMGMKKHKVALQFVTEIFIVTMVAVIIGAGIGAVTAVPVTNSMLENQALTQQDQEETREQNFGRNPMQGGGPDMGNLPDMGNPPDMGGFGGKFNEGFEEMFGAAPSEAITEITSATNFTVVLQMLGIAVLLTIVAGAASMLFIMRYEPLRILSNRD